MLLVMRVLSIVPLNFKVSESIKASDSSADYSPFSWTFLPIAPLNFGELTFFLLRVRSRFRTCPSRLSRRHC